MNGMNGNQNSSKRFLKALRHEPVDRAPFWYMRQAGRYLPEYKATRADAGSFLDLCYNPKLATEVTLQPIRRFGMDAAILFSDILVIPHALGQDVRFVEGEGPLLDPIQNLKKLSLLHMDHLHERLAPVYETIDRLTTALPTETALIGFAGAPWTVATYMVAGRGTPDQAAAKTWAYRDPEGFSKLMDLLVQSTAAYLLKQIETGAEVIQLFDTWAGSLSAGQFDRWCIQPTAAIVKILKARYPDVPILGFPRGAGINYVRFIKETGVNGVSLDATVPADWAAEALQPYGVVQGNIDQRLVVAGGQGMIDDARRILDGLKNGPHVFNLGHGFVPETPPEHVAALSDFLRDGKA
ncbi:uroporphyrinogen decarboxylase [Govanella unica]|uniref:Uroporphyrinogen decarboxylase n=1 Tax=Govanella unica TaxID=2975056 RepID=A0A9X3Z5Y7_9PROT|nr:uroporphyrinogen decarboxylase [Govania unica]MDA5192379.1 uroporphyrinogen decarboxylase [Govania unica]